MSDEKKIATQVIETTKPSPIKSVTPKGFIDNIFNDAVLKHDKSTMREDFFKNTFLKFFIGEKVDSSININSWVSIAGSPYHEVDVIDDNGSFLYSVPPLFDTSSLNPLDPNNERVSMIHVLTTASQLNRIHPNKAQAYLRNEFSRRGYAGNIVEHAKTNIGRWMDILTRYGYISKSDSNQTQQKEIIKLEFDDDL